MNLEELDPDSPKKSSIDTELNDEQLETVAGGAPTIVTMIDKIKDIILTTTTVPPPTEY